LLLMTALAFESEGNIVSPDGSLVFVLVLFLLFVFVLNRVLFRPIGKVLDQRRALIDGDTNEARAASRNSTARLAEYEAAIREARAEGYRRIEQQRIEALAERQLVIEEAKRKAASDIERAKSDIENQARAARGQLESDARKMAEQISRTLLGRAPGGAGR